MGIQQPAPAELLNIYYYLKLTRGLEQRVIALYRQGKIVGGVYLGTGEEAIAVGSAAALQSDDVIAPTHRDLGANLVKGITPKEYMAQYLARQTGLTRGRDGNVHFGDITRGIIGFISRWPTCCRWRRALRSRSHFDTNGEWSQPSSATARPAAAISMRR